MSVVFPGIGVAFDIDGLGGGNYGYRAKRLFMKYLDPQRLCATILVEGDTAATLRGQANEFCIGICGLCVDVDYVRQAFDSVDDAGFAPVHRRFIEKAALEYQPLPNWARIDGLGRLITERWNRSDHNLCSEAGWAYSPEAVPGDLEAPVLAELEDLKQPRWK